MCIYDWLGVSRALRPELEAGAGQTPLNVPWNFINMMIFAFIMDIWAPKNIPKVYNPPIWCFKWVGLKKMDYLYSIQYVQCCCCLAVLQATWPSVSLQLILQPYDHPQASDLAWPHDQRANWESCDQRHPTPDKKERGGNKERRVKKGSVFFHWLNSLWNTSDWTNECCFICDYRMRKRPTKSLTACFDLLNAVWCFIIRSVLVRGAKCGPLK